jgi:phosphonate transport system substrate-binding protein
MRRIIPRFALALCLVGLGAACSVPADTGSGDPSAETASDEGTLDTVESPNNADSQDDKAAAGSDSEAAAPAADDLPTLRISAIPDQDPEILDRLFGDVAAYLGEALDLNVEYVPVIDYAASVTAFKVGDLDLVWFGGLTGVQARLQVPGALAVAQRDIDAEFRSVFIAGKDVDIEPFDEVGGLTALAGHRFSFGSESSTSGRLMPQYFMQQSGLSLADLDGEPGFSGSHDNTLSVVASGSYEVGALNGQVWESRSEEGAPDVEAVKLLFTTPPYYDYHWVLHPETIDRYGDDFAARVLAAFEGIDGSDARETAILEAFKAGSFIATENANYKAIEAVGREIGLITD